MIGAVILAGGQSRRFGGGDKGLAVLGGRPVLAHIVTRLGGWAAAINANGETERFAAFGLPILPDDPAEFAGPLAGIVAAMRWGRARGFERVLTVPCDTPFLPRDLADRLDAARPQDGVAYAMSLGRRHVATALWPVGKADALAARVAAGLRRVDSWVAEQNAVGVAFDAADVDPFFNINTRADLDAAERFMARCGDRI